MKRFLPLVVALFPALALASPLPTAPDPARVSEAEAWRIGWPMHHGPTGNLLPARTGVALVDDLAEARLAWVSADADLGSAKTGSQTFRTVADVERRLGPEARLSPGNWAGLIVAEGRVFASTFRPAGPVFTATRLAGKNQPEVEPFRFRVEAEDLVVALDAETGRTLWRAIEPGGLIRAGGKREGFQVAPAHADGRVFSLGSTGRLFAHSAATGEKLWQTDIGPAHAAATRARDDALADATAGRFTAPDGPAWHTSLVAVAGVVVAPTYAFAKSAPHDTGLAGFSAATGEKLWEIPSACSRHATPALWHHDGRPYLLAATWTGRLRLIDPADGRVLWTLENLGPTAFTLGPSATHVMVNASPLPDPKAKRHPGRWGAVRLSLARGELAWTLPDEPALRIPTWFDSVARQRAFIRDGRVFLSTEGDKTQNAPGAFLLLDESTGAILARHENTGPEFDQVTGLFYALEDRLLVRADNAHGASHGGRNPLLAWSAAPGAIRRLGDPRAPSGIDLIDFTTAYEVFMELPVVAGRVFERTANGRVVCYDLRRPSAKEDSSREIALAGGFIGLPEHPLPVVLRLAADGRVLHARALPPDSAAAGLPHGTERRDTTWLVAPAAENPAPGEVALPFGSYRWPTRLQLVPSAGGGLAGRWTRPVPGLATTVSTKGLLSGPPPAPERRYPTPWLRERPVTSFGPLPAGTLGHVLTLADAIPFGKKPSSLLVLLDNRAPAAAAPAAITRSVATAFSYNQSWHEIDASALRLTADRIDGELRVILNPDRWTSPAPDGLGVAGRIQLRARLTPEGWRGDYAATWGAPETFTGEIHPGADLPSRP